MPDASSDHGDGLYSIKFELLISADGTIGPCVFVMVHGGMGECMTPTSILYCNSYVVLCSNNVKCIICNNTLEDHQAFKVEGLGMSCGHNDPAYLVLANRRTRNLAYHRWCIIDVLIPYVIEQRQLYGLDANFLAFCQLDGEMKQIQWFSEHDVLKHLNVNHICVCKIACLHYSYLPTLSCR